MKPSRAIQYKALFLLITFSLNSVMGFACSLEVNMGFNSGHHSQGISHHHEHADANAGHHHAGDSDNRNGHHHDEAVHKQSHPYNAAALNLSDSEENCCNDFVVAFQSMDKALVKGDSSVQQRTVVFLSAFIQKLFYEIFDTKGFAQHHRIPPKALDHSPPDIRVFIQSFLI